MSTLSKWMERQKKIEAASAKVGVEVVWHEAKRGGKRGVLCHVCMYVIIVNLIKTRRGVNDRDGMKPKRSVPFVI